MGILQARILEWVAMPSSRVPSQTRGRTHVSHIAGGFFIVWTTREQVSINFMAAVTAHSDFGTQENNCHCFHIFSFCLPWSDGTGCHDLSFVNVVSSQYFYSPLSLSSRGSLVPLHFLPLQWYHLQCLRLLISLSNLDFSLWFVEPGISHDVLYI